MRWMAIWPGLAGVWFRGRWTSLAGAMAFAAALNFALITSLVWPHLLGRDLPVWLAPLSGWVLVLWFWVAGRRGTGHILAEEAAKSLQPDAAADAALAEAQTEYLKGHWMEAQSMLAGLLTRHPGDAEARLLLASVYRRSGRAGLAGEQLALLEGLSGATRWREEIAQERRRLLSPQDSGDVGEQQTGSSQGNPERRAA